MRQISYRHAHKRAEQAFNLWIRLKDADSHGLVTCVSCARVFHYKETDAGHFIANRLDFEPRNKHPQCRYCNRYLHGNLIEYTLRMISLYGSETVDELRLKAHQTLKYTIPELLAIEAEYKEKIKAL